ncbi:Hypothetical predicted protein, partial [Prunus dulcis]
MAQFSCLLTTPGFNVLGYDDFYHHKKAGISLTHGSARILPQPTGKIVFHDDFNHHILRRVCSNRQLHLNASNMCSISDSQAICENRLSRWASHHKTQIGVQRFSKDIEEILEFSGFLLLLRHNSQNCSMMFVMRWTANKKNQRQ